MMPREWRLNLRGHYTHYLSDRVTTYVRTTDRTELGESRALCGAESHAVGSSSYPAERMRVQVDFQ